MECIWYFSGVLSVAIMIWSKKKTWKQYRKSFRPHQHQYDSCSELCNDAQLTNQPWQDSAFWLPYCKPIMRACRIMWAHCTCTCTSASTVSKYTVKHIHDWQPWLREPMRLKPVLGLGDGCRLLGGMRFWESDEYFWSGVQHRERGTISLG